VRRYEALCETLIALFAHGVYWGYPDSAAVFVQALERVANPPGGPAGYNVWINLRLYPALLLVYAAGIAAARKHDEAGYAVLLRLLSGVRIHDESVPLMRQLWPASIVHEDMARQCLLPDRRTPVSDHLFDVMRHTSTALIPDDVRYEEAFLRWEYLLALNSARIAGPIPLGQFVWREVSRGPYIIRDTDAEIERSPKWPPLAAGFFDGDINALHAARELVARAIQGRL